MPIIRKLSGSPKRLPESATRVDGVNHRRNPTNKVNRWLSQPKLRAGRL
ncbi:hypothetical protein [Eikenella corrodens]|nr:hypothetical protein [Eikenella corrodens]